MISFLYDYMNGGQMRMKKTVIWLDNYLEEFFMVISLILMTVIMGIQVFSRYVLGSAPSWSEEITRYLFDINQVRGV